MSKCKHPITHVYHMAMGGIDMGVQIICVDCGTATQYVRSFKAARKAWEAGRVTVNDVLEASAANIRKQVRLTDAQMRAR